MTHKTTIAAAASGRNGKNRCGELAGRSAADCAAVACCCPCSIMSLLVLAVYKVPAGLCRKAVRRKRQRVVNKRRAANHRAGSSVGSVSDVASDDSVADLLKKSVVDDGDKAAGDFENEMWARFSGAGFWRSPSTREPTNFGK